MPRPKPPTPPTRAAEAAIRMVDAIAALRPALTSVLGDLAFEPRAGIEDALLTYLDLLVRWNRTYNLTAIRDPANMLVQHLADCLAIIRPLQREMPSAGGRVLDVGSGGGLPGVVIAIACPGMQVTCVDAVGKKAAFVRQVAAELGLGNLAGLHSRVEELRAPEFAVVVSRAFASLADFTRLTGRALSDGGVWLAMKGVEPTDEIVALPPVIEVFHVEPLRVPGLAAERCLVWMRRRAPRTPTAT